ncbi:hypothetical protein [Sulfolobus tengchongensis spindle-shaped virus 3]|nr:hypothetical protein [Sulfolobus tengchongensis spindle-shaped virus 3]
MPSVCPNRLYVKQKHVFKNVNNVNKICRRLLSL